MKLFEEDLTKEDMSENFKIGDTVVGYTISCNPQLVCKVDLGNGNIGTCTLEEIEVLLGNKKENKRIAAISCVGKYRYFKVTGMKGGEYILSRRSVQEDYYNEHISGCEYKGTYEGRVRTIKNRVMYIDIGYGILGLLYYKDLMMVRIDNPEEFLKEISTLRVFIDSIDGYRINLGHKELLGTFDDNIQGYEEGGTYAGIVTDIKDYGVYVQLSPGLSGLANVNSKVKVGDEVSVYLKKIKYDTKQVNLRIVSITGHHNEWYRYHDFEYMDMKDIPRDWKYGL